MKRLIGIVALLCFGTTVIAQFIEKHQLYFSTLYNLGSVLVYDRDYDLTYSLNAHYSAQIGWTNHLKPARNLPRGYRTGLSGRPPTEHFETYYLVAGKIWTLNQSGRFRFNLSAGLGLTKFRGPTNWQALSPGFLSATHRFEYQDKHILSAVINPKLEAFWRVDRGLFRNLGGGGIVLSPMMLITSKLVYWRPGVGFMIWIGFGPKSD